jgi:hypothetical protein
MRLPIAALLLLLIGALVHGAPTPVQSLLDLPKAEKKEAASLQRQFAAAHPVEADWLLQDRFDFATWAKEPSSASLSPLVNRLLGEQNTAGFALPAGEDLPAWAATYFALCERRRARRLAHLRETSPKIVFVQRRPVSPSFFAYTEGQSDAQKERHFQPGSAICQLEVGDETTVRDLLRSDKGVLRNMDVSYDGTHLLFAWKKDDRKDDYHLYEMPIGGKPRQITYGLGAADFEPVYLPNDEIVFSSSRCVQTVDCWWTEVSNLYTCDRQGRGLRRLGFDQVHTVWPTVTPDGSVIYTRWDYNDRGQVFPQGLFRMNPDGTGQTEFYGNNSYFPTTISHARAIPGTNKVLAVAMGHHTWQAGKLIEIDPGKGRQEADGVTMLAPRRPAKAERIDQYGQNGELFRHPYPLGENQYLCAFVPAELNRGRGSVFGLYWISADGRRELLSQDAKLSANCPVPLRARPRPHLRPSLVDYRQTDGTYYLQDIYRGPGLQGIPRGTIKRLRVVALEFRAAGVGNNGNHGPAGGALVSTPIAIGNGAWDVKRVLGDATVQPDGSAFFTCPARTPVYFQALDAKGHAVQTMRSWSTLQPGETFSCVGCHESKNETPADTHALSMAMRQGPQPLKPFYGKPRGFSFVKEIQPILDRNCIRCHGPGKSPDGVELKVSHCWRGDTATAITDGIEPKNSDDHSIPRHTWWDHRGTKEWAMLEFPKPKRVGITEVYWFDDRPRNGGCRVPASWALEYRRNNTWHEVEKPSGYGIERDRYNQVTFTPVLADALRIQAQLEKNRGGGILEWRIGDREIEKGATRPQLVLSGDTASTNSGRHWSTAYLALTNQGKGSDLVNWISAQSIPSMLPPYHKGAAKSRLLTLLAEGHHDVKLTQEELDKVACWIDLLVPYCGDYTEANAWNEADQAKYAYFQRKRDRLEQIERRHIEDLVRRTTDPNFRFDEGYTNVALNPFCSRGEPTSYPHASSNSECRNEACFAARNVIDGRPENQGHGPLFPSWGPDRREDLWLRIDFGGKVEIDRIDLSIRADFPHDAFWHEATVEFSDGSRETLTIAKDAAPQTFRFAKRQVDWLRFVDLKQTKPLGWAAWTEVEVWGKRVR